MFESLKKSKEDLSNTYEGVKAAGKTVEKFKEVKDKVFTWMGENPEKVVLIGLGAIITAVVTGEVRRSKTEVNVHVNITPELYSHKKV